MMRKRIRIKRIPDMTLMLIIFSLLIFGVLMVYDSSVVYADTVFGGKYYFLILQSFWVGLSLIIAFCASQIDYHRLETHTFAAMAVSLFFLVILSLHQVLPGNLLAIYEIFVPKLNGAYRWFYLNPKPLPAFPLIGRVGFQPSEFAKIAVSFYLATLLKNRRGGQLFRGMLVSFLTAGLIVTQPDFGTAMIIIVVSLMIYYISGASLKSLLTIGIIILIFSVVFIGSSSYRRERLMTFLNPSGSDTLSSRYQVNQIMIALGSGGLTGLGFGKSVQKYGYIPEVTTDSIFSIVGEEFGFIGTSLMVGLFFLLIHRSIWIINRLPDDFGRLLGSGIIGFIGIQVFINLLSMTQLIPLTGVPLPLISYGGSSLVVNLFALGILLNMSKQAVSK